MQEIARDVYEAMQQTRPAEARVWQEWIENGEARIVDPEWEEVPTGIPTARISRATWQADREWKQKNPEGRLKAIWYPKAGRLGLVRLSGLAQTLEHQGEEVDYPTFEDQPTTWTVHSDPGPAVTVKLEWVE